MVSSITWWVNREIFVVFIVLYSTLLSMCFLIVSIVVTVNVIIVISVLVTKIGKVPIVPYVLAPSVIRGH